MESQKGAAFGEEMPGLGVGHQEGAPEPLPRPLSVWVAAAVFSYFVCMNKSVRVVFS